MSSDLPQAPRWLSGLRRLDRWVATCHQAIVLITMLTVLAFTFGQALDRHFLKTSFSAHDQMAKIALIWLVFSGTAVAYQRCENLRIDLLEKYLPQAAQRWRSVAFEVMILFLAVLLHVKAWSVIQVAAFQQILGTPFTNVLPYSAILAGTVAIALSCTVRIASELTRATHASRAELREPD